MPTCMRNRKHPAAVWLCLWPQVLEVSMLRSGCASECRFTTELAVWGENDKWARKHHMKMWMRPVGMSQWSHDEAQRGDLYCLSSSSRLKREVGSWHLQILKDLFILLAIFFPHLLKVNLRFRGHSASKHFLFFHLLSLYPSILRVSLFISSSLFGPQVTKPFLFGRKVENGSSLSSKSVWELGRNWQNGFSLSGSVYCVLENFCAQERLRLFWV